MRTIGFLAVLILLPSCARATVIFTEVMYDVSGTDTGREWVEITNTSGEAIDVSGFKLSEANVNHSLSLVSGEGTLESGSSAVIADDPTKFKADWPAYAGALFDASFSLSNTGESLSLKDGSLEVLDTVSYDSAMGAQGDGSTLQWNGSGFVAAPPTPGSYAGTAQGVSETTLTPASGQNVSAGGASAYIHSPPALSIELTGSRSATLGVPLRLLARVAAKGGTLGPPVQITWAFGDGSSATGDAVEKIYRYAGTYLVTADAFDGTVRAHSEMTVTARPANVSIAVSSSDGIAVANGSDERLDLSGWRLASAAGSFRIPDGTVILPRAAVIFPFSITNLSVGSEVTLAFPDGAIAARNAPLLASVEAVTPVPARQPLAAAAGYQEVQDVTAITTSPAESVSFHEETVMAPAAATELAAAGAAPAVSLETAAEPPTARVPALFRSPWVLGFLSVVALAGSAFVLL